MTDYLLKRGFTKTEHVFRQESSHLGPDGRPIQNRVEDMGPLKYKKAFNTLRDWVENNLDIYKARCFPCTSASSLKPRSRLTFPVV